MLHLSILGTVNLSSRTDVQTDLQNVPVDTKTGLLKLLILLVKHLNWCIRKALNLIPGAPHHSPNHMNCKHIV